MDNIVYYVEEEVLYSLNGETLVTYLHSVHTSEEACLCFLDEMHLDGRINVLKHCLGREYTTDCKFSYYGNIRIVKTLLKS